MRIEKFIGKEVEPYIPHIAHLRMEVFREWPYLYEGDLPYEEGYLKKFSSCERAIFVVAFDGEKVVGVSTGMPLDAEMEEVQKPFIESGENLLDYFYFSESVLRKSYRGQGIGVKFFDERESYVAKLGGFKKIVFAAIERDAGDPRRPKNYVELGPFWNRRGYNKQPKLFFTYPWKEIDEERESLKKLIFWMREL